jgi:phage-related protein
MLGWLDFLDPMARARCRVRLERLAELGFALRRPEADFLRDGIHELRVKHRGMNTRMLYIFHGKTTVVLSHGLSKQRAEIPARAIEVALRHKAAFMASPYDHVCREVK